MAIHLARSLLRRYPALRSTWPLQQASAWRERQSRRARPRRMASWYRDTADMHTRLFMSNLELPEAPHLCEPTTVLLTLAELCPRCGAKMEWRHSTWQCPRCRWT